ncbi:chaplin [Streptomyces sp. JB150]|uniref:chaplin n=1 Tax=Streptomyces sp. JB150 TaxID=2714844 RepID=UPI0019D160E7|nr:chaplin [Streptomyces sp. JB150]
MRTIPRIAVTVVAGAALALGGAATATAGTSDGGKGGKGGDGICGTSGACAYGVAVGSPGVLSGNVIQIPVDLDLNVCGNSINVIGLGNPATGNYCSNG